VDQDSRGLLSATAPPVRHNEKARLAAGFITIGIYLVFMVARSGIEPLTRGFSVQTWSCGYYIFQ